MKVVVTGGNGRVGRYVVAELLRSRASSQPHEVTVFDRTARRLPRRVTQVIGDHGNIDAMVGAFHGADAVLHLSALQPRAASPEEVYSSNLAGTNNVLDAARKCGVGRVVYWSSVWALGWSRPGNAFIPDYLPIDEKHPLRENDSYGRSKIEGEAAVAAAHGQNGVQTMTLRPVYTALPATVARLWRTNGLADPTYSHLAYVDVRDQARAARQALESTHREHVALYLAADDSRVAAPLCDLLPQLYEPIGDRAAALVGTRSSISNERAKQLLGWRPTHTWRSVTIGQKLRGSAAVAVRAGARTIVPATVRERLRAGTQ